jgi:hypothetical protein
MARLSIGGAAWEIGKVEVTVDIDGVTVDASYTPGSGAVQATVEAPVSLNEILQAVPSNGVFDWLPSIALDALGMSFEPGDGSFGVYATAGLADSSTPSADLFVGTVPAASGGAAAYVVGLGIDSSLNLGGVPLFGAYLSGISISDLAVTYASGPVAANSVVLPPPSGAQPAFPAGLSLGFLLTAPGGSQAFTLTPSPSSGGSAGRGPESGGTPAMALALTAPAAGSGQPPIQWFSIGKTFGPLTLNRIGAVTTDSSFGLALDAGLAMGTLSIELDGFTLMLQKNDISISGLSVSLQGLSVSMQTGTVSVSGGLIRTMGLTGTEYDGTALIQIGSYGISAVGSFAEVDGSPSLFIFGLAQGPFGGPPAFFITGLAAGFGYNRSLTLPAPDQVSQFPLVAMAQNPGSVDGAQAALSQLSQGGWVPPTPGTYWVAAGVQFTSFELVHSFALLTVQFGSDLVIALLGTATVQLPTAVDSSATYAYAELMLDAVLRPDQGTFQATALLSPNSYVLDPACQLTGGFATNFWFSPSGYAGDFVVTLGGYNPNFMQPPWYPSVPRLGFDWKVSGEIEVTGGAYFAITPSCGMAGGRLSITYNSGPLSAWFTAWADFTVYWRPFYFVADIGVSVGASYTMNLLFTHATFSVTLSVDLDLWGPPVAGVAHVSWWVISFSVNINGGGDPQPPGAILGDWDTFATTFLPLGGVAPVPCQAPATTTSQPTTTICQARAVSGLLQVFQPASGTGPATWLVAGDAFVVATSSVIPSTSASIPSTSPNVPTVTIPGISSSIGVYPMAVTATSIHTVTLAGDESVPLASWSWTAVSSGVPSALWGTGNEGEATLGADNIPALVGVVGTPPPTPLAGPPSLAVSVLQDPLAQRPMPLPGGAPINGSTEPPVQNPMTAVETTIAALAVVSTRTAIVASLNTSGIGSGLVSGDLSLLAQDAGFALQAPPMLGPVGTDGPVSSGQIIGAARYVRPTPSLRAPPALQLRGLFRRWPARNDTRARAWVVDRFATKTERLVASSALTPEPGGRAGMTLRRGMTLLWEVTGATAVALSADGTLPLRVSVFGEYGLVLQHAVLEAGRQCSLDLPAGARRLAVTALSGLPNDRDAVGWYGLSTLLQLSPRAFCADGALVRPQAPIRIRHARGTRDTGVMSGRDIVAANRTEGRNGTGSGWLETRLPASTRIVMLPLLRRTQAHTAAAIPPEQAVEIRAMRGDRGVALTARHTASDAATALLAYGVDEGDEPLRVRVRTAEGWTQDGLIGQAETQEPDILPALRWKGVCTDDAAATMVVFR